MTRSIPQIVAALVSATILSSALPTNTRAQDETERDRPLAIRVPDFDEPIEIVQPPQVRLANLTIAFYEAISEVPVTHEEPNCTALADRVRLFLDDNESEIGIAADELAELAVEMPPEKIAEIAAAFQSAVTEHPATEIAQKNLYICLYSLKIQGRGRPLDKEMDRYFTLHKKMVLTFTGNVD